MIVTPDKMVPPELDQQLQPMQDNQLPTETACDAEKWVQSLGSDFRNKDGNSLMHLSANLNPAIVHVCVNLGVPVNAQNFDGDTALHLAVRHNRFDTATSLLMCSSDLSIRNKLGQTALDEACGPMKHLLSLYKPGLVQTILKGEYGTVHRLVKLWCNVNAKVKDDQSALEMASSKASSDPNIQKCHNTLNEHRKTLELIHAVLAEDVNATDKILCAKGRINVNARFRDKYGLTPVAVGIMRHNLDVVKLLTNQGKCNLNLRVREHDMTNTTVPLYFKTLDRECPQEIWEFVQENTDAYQDSERDACGNTAIFRAIENCKPACFIAEMIKRRKGACIIERNMDGNTPREVAEELEKWDIVDVIDKYLLCHIDGTTLIHLPINFYGFEKTNIKDSEGQCLVELVASCGTEEDIQAIKNYLTVELYGVKLFQGAATGNLKDVAKYNKAPYKDQNGYTALTRAIVFNQLRAAETLVTERPCLKSMPDNCNRYPLHYAYSLPDNIGLPFVKLLLSKDPKEIEHKVDKDGREAVEYKEIRETLEVKQMLVDACVLDPFRKRGPPMGQIPDHIQAFICDNESVKSEC